ncbi:MAG: YraN family protein [candidate division KSB1 bacterium]|nr:YraN family protein [candidate division KSB1 bacterium]
MTSTRRSRGLRGEEIAARHLLANGWQIVARNVRLGRYEIDLIAREGNTLVFVEVKTASGPRFGSPEDWITPRKRRSLVRAALRYLAEHGLENIDCRFDVVAIERGARSTRLRHYRGAFSPEPGDLPV